MIKGVGKNLRRKEKRARIEQIRANLGLSDSQRTPAVILHGLNISGQIILHCSQMEALGFYKECSLKCVITGQLIFYMFHCKARRIVEGFLSTH